MFITTFSVNFATFNGIAKLGGDATFNVVHGKYHLFVMHEIDFYSIILSYKNI
jgi:hypothetical protein